MSKKSPKNLPMFWKSKNQTIQRPKASVKQNAWFFWHQKEPQRNSLSYDVHAIPPSFIWTSFVKKRILANKQIKNKKTKKQHFLKYFFYFTNEVHIKDGGLPSTPYEREFRCASFWFQKKIHNFVSQRLWPL